MWVFICPKNPRSLKSSYSWNILQIKLLYCRRGPWFSSVYGLGCLHGKIYVRILYKHLLPKTNLTCEGLRDQNFPNLNSCRWRHSDNSSLRIPSNYLKILCFVLCITCLEWTETPIRVNRLITKQEQEQRKILRTVEVVKTAWLGFSFPPK